MSVAGDNDIYEKMVAGDVHEVVSSDFIYLKCDTREEKILVRYNFFSIIRTGHLIFVYLIHKFATSSIYRILFCIKLLEC